jgi:hypothetical protein
MNYNKQQKVKNCNSFPPMNYWFKYKSLKKLHDQREKLTKQIKKEIPFISQQETHFRFKVIHTLKWSMAKGILHTC